MIRSTACCMTAKTWQRLCRTVRESATVLGGHMAILPAGVCTGVVLLTCRSDVLKYGGSLGRGFVVM